MALIHIPPPIFVRANFIFSALGRDYSYLSHAISLYGVSGLHWENFDPSEEVGVRTAVTLDVQSQQRYRFSTAAHFTAEISASACYLGMKFELEELDRMRLSEIIEKEGFTPSHYLRKYPRIPAWSTVPSMPLRTIVQTSDGLISFDIANISPNGILLYTENPKASLYYPGGRILAQVEPRGDIFESFDFEGVVCRMMLEKNPNNSNITRYLGIRFLNISEPHKERFLEILRSILDKIQKGHYITPSKSKR